jgi:predicted Zn finger-like uncharacterized protein
MALATKCPHCHTVFRVALDQLKLRGGIVRCGACSEIFDGNAALVATSAAATAPAVPDRAGADILPEAPARLPAFAATPAVPVVDRREPGFDMPSEHIVAVALDDLHHFDEAPDEEELHEEEPNDEARNDSLTAAVEPEPHDITDRAADDAAAADLLAAAPDSALLAAGAGTFAATPHATAQDARDGQSEAAAEPVDEPAADEPDFVRRANRRQRAAGAKRIALIAGIPLLALVLLVQGMVSLRNRLATDYPGLKPALQAVCGTLGCTIDLPRQIDALAVEQGELQTLAPATYSYVTVLRNQSRSVQAWPHIELVLKDAADKPVLRRVFAPRDYLVDPSKTAGRATDAAAGATLARGFGPRSEQSVKLYFVLDKVKASGYRIAIFYP